MRRLLVVLASVAALAAGCAPASVASPVVSGAPTAAAVVGSASPSAAPTATASASATIGPSPSSDVTAIDTTDALRLRQSGFPDWISVAGGAAWVATEDGIQRLDHATGAPGVVVPVTSICTAMDTALKSLWAADCSASELIRIDPGDGTVSKRYPVTSAPIQQEGSVTATRDSAWVATGDVALTRIDLRTGKATATPLPGMAAGVRAGLGSVWVTLPDKDELLRIDPADGSIVAEIPVGAGPRFLAVGEGGVWVQNNRDGTVTHVDQDGAVVATISVDPSGIDGGDIATGGGFVWARITRALVAKIDPATDAVVAVYGPGKGSGSVAADDEAAWITAHDVSSIWRLPLR
jgi:hypothetical protein